MTNPTGDYVAPEAQVQADESKEAVDVAALATEVQQLAAQVGADEVAEKATQVAQAAKDATQDAEITALEPPPPPPPPPAPAPPPSPVEQLLPASGALWGVYCGGNDLTGYQSIETAAGRRFDLFRCYHDLAGTTPSDAELAFAATRTLTVNLAPLTYSGQVPAGYPKPQGTDGKTWLYQQITAGALNVALDRIIARLAPLNAPFMLTFQGEPEGAAKQLPVSPGGNGPAEFVAAWRHVHDYLTAKLPLAVWVLNFATVGSQPDSVYKSYYPGDDVVDVVAWDPYSHNPADVDAGGSWQTGYGKFVGGLLGGQSASKPLMLTEYGRTADANRDAWLASIPAALKARPQIKAVCYWSSAVPNEDFRLTGDAGAIAAFGLASQDLYCRTRP